MLTFIISCGIACTVSFLCSLTEAVLLSLNQIRLETLHQQGKRYAGQWLEMKRNVDRPIAAILILNTISHTGGATVAGAAFAQIWGDDRILLFSVLFTVVILFGTEIAPKVIGVAFSQRLAPVIIGPLRGCIAMLRPLIFVTDIFSRFFRSRAGAHGGTEVEAADIVTLAQLAKSRSLIDYSQEKIIVGAARLTETSVAQIMLPRAEIVFFQLGHSTAENLRLSRQSLHTRYPVSETADVDGIAAYVNFKEIFAVASEERAPELHPYLRRILFIRPQDKLNEILKLFINRKCHLAIVKDEGAVVGLVTLEDVLDEIVGEVEDDLDAGALDLIAAGRNRWTVGGAVTFAALAEVVGQPLPVPATTTLSEYLAVNLGRFQHIGGTTTVGPVKLTVTQVRRGRAHLVLAEL